MCIFGLQNIAKEVNYQGYKEWLIKWNVFLNLDILEKGENDVAVYITPYLKQKLVFCRESWWLFEPKTCLWSVVKQPTATIITTIQQKVNEARECLLATINRCGDEEEKKMLEKKEKRYQTFHTTVCKGSYSSQVKNILTSYLCDNDFCNKLDDGLYRMVYRNGILDLKTLNFKNGTFLQKALR